MFSGKHSYFNSSYFIFGEYQSRLNETQSRSQIQKRNLEISINRSNISIFEVISVNLILIFEKKAIEKD
jgi:hypothetical protein